MMMKTIRAIKSNCKSLLIAEENFVIKEQSEYSFVCVCPIMAHYPLSLTYPKHLYNPSPSLRNCRLYQVLLITKVI